MVWHGARATVACGYRLALATLILLVLPAVAFGQASITGVVRDASGAVLPGVTVEASSPALIEKVRSVVTDGTGQYRIEALRAGTYDVTFTLPGFSTVKREGIELSGAFVASVNADLRVGSLEETITVTGETPMVDVQSTTRQRVLDREILDTIPSGRTQYNLGVLIPGVSLGGGQDVGGSGGQTAFPALEIHGSKAADSVETMGGMSISVLSTGSHQPVRVNPAATQEIVLDTAAGDAEYAVGGVRIHRIAREGSNTWNGTFFGSFANGDMQGNNLTQELRDRGLTTPDSIKTNKEWNVGGGGPIKRDKLWFFLAGRQLRSDMYAAGLFENANLNNQNAWTFAPDLSKPAFNVREQKDAQLRLTLQASARNKLALTVQQAMLCWCPQSARLTSALEAEPERSYPMRRITQLEWTNPYTNRLLVEGAFGVIQGLSNDAPRPFLQRGTIGVVEQSTGMAYRGPIDFSRERDERVLSARFVTSYITGAHAVKVGMTNRSGRSREFRYTNAPVTYRFNNGVPNQLTQWALPIQVNSNVNREMGIFAQDRWTVRGLTTTAGIRFSTYKNGYPEQTAGPAILAPTRNITLPAQTGSDYKDITPHLGASYDLFGNGKTALKVSVNKYLMALGAGGLLSTGSTSPVANLVNNTTRAWTDANRNFVPDCDLISTAANGECGAMDNPAFGGVRAGTTFDPDMMAGWGKRLYNWEVSAGVQHEIVQRVSADFGYFRRAYGNFQVTDNRAVSASDYDTFSLTAPSDPRLPGGGGYAVSGLYDLKPAAFGRRADNVVTFAENYGDQVEYWQGFDVTLNARPRQGLLLQGGTSTGRTVTDRCDVLAAVPEASLAATVLNAANAGTWAPLGYCHETGAFLTQAKFLGSYIIPRVGVQVSGTFQSLPGPHIVANFVATNAIVAPGLGRNLAGNAANLTVNIVEPGQLYGERVNQLDVRIAKVIRAGRARINAGVDLYNMLNTSAPLALNNSFGRWQQPTEILLARFLKLNINVDF